MNVNNINNHHPIRNAAIQLTATSFSPEDLIGKTAVIIDVLRATSVIVTALANGATRVVPLAGIDEVRLLAGPGSLLCGERNAWKPDGFDLGNSPLEYLPEVVRNQEILLTTTNGTLATSRAIQARKVLAGSFLNLQATVKEVMKEESDVELICAGTECKFSLDDFLCAGGLMAPLIQSGRWNTDDLGRLAILTWEQHHENLREAMEHCYHYQALIQKGFEKDLKHCFSLNLHNIPVVLSLASVKRSFIRKK